MTRHAVADSSPAPSIPRCRSENLRTNVLHMLGPVAARTRWLVFLLYIGGLRVSEVSHATMRGFFIGVDDCLEESGFSLIRS